MIPNGIVVAFDARVRFEPETRRKADVESGCGKGMLVIPLDEEERPGWIVDGQQRAAAIRDARVDQFPIFVNALHHRGGRRAAGAVHPRQLDQAAAEGPDPRIAARDGGATAARAAQAATASAADGAAQLRPRLAAAGPDPDSHFGERNDQGQLDQQYVTERM